jgi:replicative DNA helicase
VIRTCSDVIGDAMEQTDEIDVFLDTTETKIFQAANQQTNNPVSELKDVLVGAMSRIEELAMNRKTITGVATGFTDFDTYTAGLQAGQVMIVAARPGMGKTSWILSALQHSAIHDKSVVAVFSLEMSKEELAFRFLSGLARIDSKKLKTGKMADSDWPKLADSADKLSKARILVDDSGGLTVMQVRSRCRRIKALHKKLDLIVIDYLQLMAGPRSGKGEQSREREISEISRGLKMLAKELGCPIVAASQLNRSVESRQDKRPNLSDLRESGAIEQDADMVCFIYRDEVYNKETEDRGIAELIVAKHRAGETDTIRLAWLSEYTLFANLADDAPGTPVGPPRPDRGDSPML